MTLGSFKSKHHANRLLLSAEGGGYYSLDMVCPEEFMC